MAKAPKLFLCALVGLFCMAAALAGAQNAQGSSSIILNIQGSVPTLLEVKVGLSNTNTMKLIGLLNAPEATQGDSGANLRAFPLGAAERIELGELRIYANVKGTYYVRARSANGGFLKNSEHAASGSIPYALVIDGKVVYCENLEFRFATTGRTKQGGNTIAVALEVGTLQDGLPRGKYSDQLVFSISSY